VPLLRRKTGTRLFYAADLHGSTPAWRKFINAASFYGVQALVFGGDIMGKALVPIVRSNGDLRATFQGEEHTLEPNELDAFSRSVEVAGFYWKVLEPDEYAWLRNDPIAIEALTQDLARERLRSWFSFANERLAGTDVRVYVTGGNDDAPAVLDEMDAAGGSIVASEGRVVDLDGEHSMITVGYSTPTPWDTPREATEDDLAAMIDDAVRPVPDVSRCVFNFHCPPKDSPLDRCLLLDTDHVLEGQLPKPVRVGGRFLTTGGGSRAVTEAISRYQPTVGMHGHIHESAGRFRIGRTLCVNPGSEYGQGRLEGVIVQLAEGSVNSYQHTSG
jgi:Icc-related predicted phosphoesterase